MLFLWRSHWPPAWAHDLRPVLQQFLANLPVLDHIETARVERGDQFSTRYAVDWDSLSYTDTLIFSAATPRVRSVCFRGWPSPAMLKNYDNVPDQGNAATDIRRMREIVRADTRIETLTMDSSIYELLYHYQNSPYDPPSLPLDIWRQGLCQLRHVTTLTLAQVPRSELPSQLTQLARGGHIDSKLEFLLGKALILDNVKTLTLTHWILPAEFLCRSIGPLAPALETLRLHSVAILSETHRQGNELWDQTVKTLRRGGDVSVVVEKPKVCVNFGGYQRDVVPMKKKAMLALEEQLR